MMSRSQPKNGFFRRWRWLLLLLVGLDAPALRAERSQLEADAARANCSKNFVLGCKTLEASDG